MLRDPHTRHASSPLDRAACTSTFCPSRPRPPGRQGTAWGLSPKTLGVKFDTWQRPCCTVIAPTAKWGDRSDCYRFRSSQIWDSLSSDSTELSWPDLLCFRRGRMTSPRLAFPQCHLWGEFEWLKSPYRDSWASRYLLARIDRPGHLPPQVKTLALRIAWSRIACSENISPS
jgi:hypothetical protein